MLPNLNTVANSLVNIGTSLTPFSLENLDGFPYQLYTDQNARYEIFRQWYKGEPLDIVIVDKQSGKPIEKYPIKINPIRDTCKKHAARVIGQNTDSIRFGGLPFQILPDVHKEQKKQGEIVKKALLKVLTNNGFGASFLSTSIRSQYIGGSVLACKWLPETKEIEVSTPHPKQVIPIPDGSNFNRLREAWIVKEITLSDAEALGYKRKAFEDQFWYIEHWTKKDYRIQINNQVLKFSDGTRQEGAHDWGMVPVVYIPHVRIDDFLGESIITETVKGVIRELNLRWADVGDAVSNDSHDYVAIANVSNGVTAINVGDNRPVLDLGSTAGIGTTAEPKMWAVGTKSASAPMLQFIQDLFSVYRRETNHPAVADGEDEGSQRSSLTLAVRMAPLIDEAEFERLFWTVGLMEFSKILLTIMALKGLYDVTIDMVEEIPLMVQWQPMLPKDREAFSTEVAVRAKNKVTSRKKLNEMYGDITDVDEDMDQIKDEQELDQVQSPFGQNGAKPGGANPVPGKSNSGGSQKPS